MGHVRDLSDRVRRAWRPAGTGERPRRRLAVVAAAVGVASLATTTAVVLPASATLRSHRVHPARSARVHSGGTLTVLENTAYIGDWTPGFDPATSTDALAIGSVMDAIYGELFEVGTNNQGINDLASGYAFSNGNRTLTIQIRKGVTFTDGTPFDAAAVVFNIKRDLAAHSESNPAWPPLTSIAATGPDTVVLNFSAPDGAAVIQFQDTNENWIVSPTALKKEGETKFRAYPVGAGPFIMVSDEPTTKLVLKKNPHYWQPGHPYLNGLIFHTVANDETALEVMRSGGAQAYNYMDTPQLVSGFRQAGLQLTTDPAVFGTDVQMNAEIPPFNNLKAREAIYYATDAAAIDKAVYNGTCPLTESFTGPGGLFYNPKVPGYRNYDLAKAKALVKQIGGLSFTMYYFELGNVNQSEAEALQTMYQQAGMQVTIKGDPDIASLVATYNTHKWTIIPAAIGAWDPATATGVAFRLLSTGPFTGIADKSVDKYINAGVATSNPAARAKAYASLASVLNQKAYTPFICAPESWDVVKPGVQGPGLTSVTAAFGEGPLTLWEDVSMK